MDRFYEWAKQNNSNIEFWKDDQGGINDHLNEDMALGIQGARVVVFEINYAESLKKEIIIVKLEVDVELLGRGAISLIANTKLCVSIVLIVFMLIDI